MPNALIKKYSKKLHKSEKELEKIWKEAKAASIKDGIKETDKKFYAYTVTIFKRMNGINDEDEYSMGLKEGKVMSFSEFLMGESDEAKYILYCLEPDTNKRGEKLTLKKKTFDAIYSKVQSFIKSGEVQKDAFSFEGKDSKENDVYEVDYDLWDKLDLNHVNEEVKLDNMGESIVSDKFEAAQKAIGDFWHTFDDLPTRLKDLDRKTWNELRSYIGDSKTNLAKCSDTLRSLGIE
jgi:hypothetical protein